MATKTFSKRWMKRLNPIESEVSRDLCVDIVVLMLSIYEGGEGGEELKAYLDDYVTAVRYCFGKKKAITSGEKKRLMTLIEICRNIKPKEDK